MSDLPSIPQFVYKPGMDLTGLGFTQSATGHIHSPWFTYDTPLHHQRYPGETVYDMGSHWQGMREAAIREFCRALNIHPDQVVVTSMPDIHEVYGQLWRLGTKMPMPPLKPPVSKIVMPGAIDI